MIPKVFHRIWLGGPEPDWCKPFAATWLDHHRGWDMQQWGEREVAELFPLVNQDLYDRASEIAPDHVGQLRSDILRYEILHRFGGVYVDTDFECQKSIEPLIDGATCFAAWEVPNVWVNNAIFGATKEHQFISHLIDELPASVARNRGAKPNRMSGPHFVTSIYRAHPGELAVLSQAHFYPYGFAELERGGERFEDAYAVHHWHNRRRERAVPLEHAHA